MPYNTGGQNIGGQFGMPLFGVGGVSSPFTGNYFWVDQTNGSDGNTGGPQDPFGSLTQALLKCAAGNNDVVFLSGTYKPTATVAWSKNNTHLVGLAPTGAFSTASISVANTAATSGAFSPLVNVTATGCMFENITALSGIAQAATQVCWAEAGGTNTYIGCSFNQVGNATAAAQAGNRALTMASANNTFLGCVIGGDAVVRATGTNYTVDLLAGTGSSVFRGCVFPMWSSVAANAHINAATATMAGYILLDDCVFINDLQNAGFVSLTQAFNISSTAGGILLLTSSSVSVGATILNTGGTGPVYAGGVIGTAAGNKAVAAT
jgi:hypothetical protein